MNSYLASQATALANHLWQSTAFAGAAWLVTLALRRNRARLRYLIWLTASIKFLVPFSLLVSAGNLLLPHPKQPVAAVVYSAMNVIEEPFTAGAAPPPTSPIHFQTLREQAEAVLPVCLAIIWLTGVCTVLFGWWNRWRVLTVSLHRTIAAVDGREFQILRRLESAHLPRRRNTPLKLLMSAERMEPGIFGIVHPVLVWPQQLSAQLDDGHIEAIIAHELMHVRGRDNLAALAHMLVESTFWFYPLVWWMERQIVKEREHACDEAVTELGGDADIYAESLLKTCRFCIESPLACAAGVTGSNLRLRIEQILTARVIHRTEPLKMAALGVLAVLVVGMQFFFGAAGGVRAQSTSRLTFDAASVRVTNDGDPRAIWGTFQFLPGGRLVATQMPLTMLVAAAYNLPFQSQRISFAPGVKPPKDSYDIRAVGPASEFPSGISLQARDAKLRLMLQSLLVDRFQLKIRIEQQDQPAYVLVVGKDGPKLDPPKKTPEECVTDESCHEVGGGQGRGIHGNSVSIGDVALFVQNWTDKPVVDETGLKGLYNIQTEGWMPMRSRLPNPDGSAPSGPDAGLNDIDRQTLAQVFEQLGLHMESKRAVVDMYVVESVQKPTEN